MSRLRCPDERAEQLPNCAFERAGRQRRRRVP